MPVTFVIEYGLPLRRDIASAIRRHKPDTLLLFNHRESWGFPGSFNSPDHRAVVEELYFRGRTVEEASAVLGVPPGTVKSRSFYALRALRDHLPRHP